MLMAAVGMSWWKGLRVAGADLVEDCASAADVREREKRRKKRVDLEEGIQAGRHRGIEGEGGEGGIEAWRRMGRLAGMRVILIVLMFAMLGGCQPLERFEFTRLCMGVRTEVVLYAADRAHAQVAAQAAFARINEIDAEMSDYRRDSAVSRINGAAGGEAVKVSGDLVEVLTTAARVSEASGGAFDVTAGPVVKLWRRARDTGELPNDAEREGARALVDWRLVEVDRSARTVRLARGMVLDLGGIAKGFAAEEAVKKLKALGYPRSMAALAGDVFAGDPPPGTCGWRVSVGDAVEEVANAGISSSGDWQQFVEIGAARYAHIVDPRTGLGATVHRTVTVIAPHGALADALSTAAFLVGPEGAGHLRERFRGVRIKFW